ncbi:MAG: DNA polymerase III subunit delta' [Acidobacteriota bacterium]
MSRLSRLQDIIGNRDLLSLLQTRALPPAALLSGPEGVGKKTAALLLAALANCAGPRDGDLCGTCPSCIKAASGNHPDIRLYPIEPGPHIKIDEMRQMSQEVQYLPFEGKARFFIIDNAERLTIEAQNAILKTLEEPPPTSHLVLVSAYPDQLLSTIRSRCQTLAFKPISRDAIQSYLQENTELDRPDLRASFSAGSLGRALDLDLEALIRERDVLLELLAEWLETERFEVIFKMSESKAVGPVLRNRSQTEKLLETLQALCYDIYFLRVGTPERIVNRDRTQPLEQLATSTPLPRLRCLLDSISDSKRDLSRNVNPRMCFEMLWLEAWKEERRAGTALRSAG